MQHKPIKTYKNTEIQVKQEVCSGSTNRAKPL